MKPIAVACAALLLAPAAAAEMPQILDATIEKTGMSWRVDVTIRHPDTGWDHYADGWEVLDADGNRLGHRELHHPHVDEQPFTRALANLALPDDTREVFIRAHCSVDGWTEDTVRIVVQP
ncbi:hypothetical protein [Roseovarius sp. D22-M7]|uniref:hypothetical protein n=1 Tax=Roseovarius sp. D22-M7 TaxID=3127116 RepID=UPI0030100404